MDTKNYTGIDDKKLVELTSSPAREKNQHSYRYLILLACLMLFHLISNIIWISINRNPLDFDPIGHTLITINSAEYVKTHLFTFNLKEYEMISQAYPNFTHTFGVVLAFLFGNQWRVIQFSGTIFFLLSIGGTYMFVTELTKNKRVAFFTAFFYSFCISIVQYSRFHMLDIPLIAMIVITLYLWEKCKNTGQLRYLYMSAFTLGFAELTKWHAVVFLFIPALYLLIWFYQQQKIKLKQIYVSLALCIAIVMVLVFPWYYCNLESFIRLGAINYKGEADDPHTMLSIINIFFYPGLLINYQIQFGGALLFIFSLGSILLKKIRPFVMPLLTMTFVYIFFTFFVINKNIRVLFPIMPLVALTLAYGTEILMASTRHLMRVGKILLYSFLIYLVFSFFTLSFGIPLYPNYRSVLSFPLIGPVEVIYLHTYPVNLLYSTPEIPFAEILNTLLSISKNSDSKPLRTLTAVHQPYLSNGHMVLAVYSANWKNITQANSDIFNKQLTLSDVSAYVNREDNFEEYLADDYDAIMTTAKNPIHPEQKYDAFYSPLIKIQQYLLHNSDNFDLYASYRLSNDDRLLLYINKKLHK